MKNRQHIWKSFITLLIVCILCLGIFAPSILAAENSTGITANASEEGIRATLALDSINYDNSQSKTMPVYTIVIRLRNCALTEKFSTSDIRFDGAFANTEIQSLSVNNNDKNFTIVIRKAVNTDPGHSIQGHLILNTGSVYLENDQIDAEDKSLEDTLSLMTRQKNDQELTVSLTDTYQTEETNHSNDTSTVTKDKNAAALLASDMRAEMIKVPGNMIVKVMDALLKDTLAGNSGISALFGGVVNGLFDLFSAEDASKNQMMNALTEIDTKIDNLSAQLDSATKEIINEVDKNTLERKIDTIASDAQALEDCRSGNEGIGTAINLTEANKTDDTSLTKIKRGYTGVYNTENNNYNYYNALMHFGNDIIGNKVIISDKDVYALYQGYQTYACDWNSQTFDARSQFNHAVSKYFLQNYANVKAAIVYDLEMNRGELAVLENYVNELQTLIDSGTLDSNGLIEAESTMSDSNRRIGELEMCISQAETHEAALNTLSEKVTNAYKTATDTLNSEKKTVEEGTIYSYRLKRNFSADLIPVSATIYNNVTVLYNWDNNLLKDYPTLSTADYQTLITGAEVRGYTNLYDELLAAGFKVADGTLVDSSYSNIKDYGVSAENFQTAYATNKALGFYISGNARFEVKGNAFTTKEHDRIYIKTVNLKNDKINETCINDYSKGVWWKSKTETQITDPVLLLVTKS